MATLNDYSNELLGYIPKLSILLSAKLVNRAWRDIRDSRRWSFLLADGVLQAIGQITAGSVTATQFTNQIVLDADAAAAVVSAITINNPPITTCQFRMASGPIYSIVNYDGPSTTITLDRAFQEPGGAGLQYLIYRCYYAPPTSDFLRWVSIFDPINNYRIRRNNLSCTKAEIDRADPQRGAFSTPIKMASYKNPSTGPLWEMWPHPISQISYICLYERRGVDMAPGDSLPDAIPEDLLMDRARYHAYQWALTQPNPDQIDFKTLLLEAKQGYAEQLKIAQRQDEETFLQNFSDDEMGAPNFPIDSNYLQSHDF